jgi:D-glycero-D-manno-heptose 1,7-bisphosphate phosphatase
VRDIQGGTGGGRRAVFLDRDGTLIQERHYLADPEGVRLIAGCPDALRRLRDAGYLVVVVTNQSGIDRGIYTLDDYHAVAARLSEALAREGALPDATYFCPHHPDGSGPCDCRKPATGMYRRAAADLGIDLRASWYVGDKITDVEPALTLGGRGILVRSGYGSDMEHEVPAGVAVVDDVGAAARLIVGVGDGPGGR